MFILGVLASTAYSYLSLNSRTPGTFTNEIAPEQSSPSNWIKKDQVEVYEDKIIITGVNNAEWAELANSNSMDPVFDEDSNTIEIKPENPEDINEGDIISYKHETSFIIHRVIETGYDNDGWYAITKGDNNRANDPSKIRFNQVQGVVIAVLY